MAGIRLGLPSSKESVLSIFLWTISNTYFSVFSFEKHWKVDKYYFERDSFVFKIRWLKKKDYKDLKQFLQCRVCLLKRHLFSFLFALLTQMQTQVSSVLLENEHYQSYLRTSKRFKFQRNNVRDIISIICLTDIEIIYLVRTIDNLIGKFLAYK
jgi:hypothetical protein